jgi:glycosyltransferase involved in cell wall biosynthesis
LHCQITTEGLRARGHIVQVLTSDFGVNTPAAPRNENGVERSLRIHGLFGNPWLGIRQLEKLERHNNQTLRSAISRFSPDLVYVWNMGGLSKSMLFTLERMNVPTDFCVCDHWIARSVDGDVWSSWWNRQNTSLKHRLLRWFWTVTGKRQKLDSIAPTCSAAELRFSRIHFCSRFLRNFTAEAGFDVSHGTTIHCPIRTDFFRKEPRNASEPLMRLLYAGRLHPDKGVMTALKALALIRDKFAGELTICGRGDATYENTLKQFVRERKLPVTFTSVSNPEEMREIYHSHHALLFTSEWPEPFGMTWAEAMACGLPVICTRIGGSTELLRHRENALTYTPGCPEELARRILELDKDPALRTTIATAGQAEMRSLLNARFIVEKIEQHLLETAQNWKRNSTTS